MFMCGKSGFTLWLPYDFFIWMICGIVLKFKYKELLGLTVSVTLSFIRHGEAAGNWDNAVDPGLSDLGKSQATALARRLQDEMAVTRIFSSPLMRTRETAEPLGLKWQQNVEIVPQLIEIPSVGIALAERRTWLSAVLQGDWNNQMAHLRSWRSDILDFVRGQKKDAVFVTHFVVINALVGAAEDSDKVVVFKPDHCSVTKIRLTNDHITLLERGTEAVTVVR